MSFIDLLQQDEKLKGTPCSFCGLQHESKACPVNLRIVEEPMSFTARDVDKAVKESCTCNGSRNITGHGLMDGYCQACEVWHRLNGRI